MNPSVPHMTWIVKCDTNLSDAREVFSPDDDCESRENPFERCPMYRAYQFARFHVNECNAEGFGAGTVTVACREFFDSTRKVIYVDDPTF